MTDKLEIKKAQYVPELAITIIIQTCVLGKLLMNCSEYF